MANDLTRAIMANLAAGRPNMWSEPSRGGGGPLLPREEELLAGLIGGAEAESSVRVPEAGAGAERFPAAGRRGISLSELARRQGRSW